jgi:LPXTG-motif cell wall-anchored protein
MELAAPAGRKMALPAFKGGCMFIARRRSLALLLAFALALLFVPAALAEGETVIMTHNPVLGNILTDSDGRTLYRFMPDRLNESSACYDRCAVSWPPLLVAEGNPVAGEGVNGNLLGVLARKDGTRQVMFNGIPLYYYQNDHTPGDINGQGVRATWFIVKPDTAAPGAQAVAVRAAQSSTLGNILTDAQGRTLYMFMRDKENFSVCYDRCAATWPPLLAGAGGPSLAAGLGGKVGLALRNDGNHQVTYDGKPLYYFAPDTAPGDTKGQAVGNVWFVINPAAASAPAAPAAPSAPAPAPASLPNTGAGSDAPLGALIALALLLIAAGGFVTVTRRSRRQA